MKNLVGGVPATAGALKEVTKVLSDITEKGGNGTFSLDELKRFARRENPFSPARISKKLCAEWERLYRDEFGIYIDLARVAVTDNHGGFDRVIVVVRDFTIERVIAACRKYFKVVVYREDLDVAINKNERTPSVSYAIRVRERSEADEELKNFSADDVRATGMATETLLERLLHELKYFRETGRHLDAVNLTLASGSRNEEGNVPCVDWNPGFGSMNIDWYSPVDRDNDLRPRAVFSV